MLSLIIGLLAAVASPFPQYSPGAGWVAFHPAPVPGATSTVTWHRQAAGIVFNVYPRLPDAVWNIKRITAGFAKARFKAVSVTNESVCHSENKAFLLRYVVVPVNPFDNNPLNVMVLYSDKSGQPFDLTYSYRSHAGENPSVLRSFLDYCSK